MKIISDTHFGHTNMLLYEPFRMQKARMEGYEDFDEFLIDWLNDYIKKDDEVLHLGDVAFKNNYKLVKKLNGKITLIKGNHDKQAHIDYYKSIGWRVIENIEIEINDFAKDFVDYLKDKYDKTTKYAIGEIEGREIYITEFLMAKELGYIDRFQGHRELISYLKLIPFLFVNSCFHDMYKNIHDNRVIFAINENERKIFHVVDENDFLVSVFVVSKQNFEKRLGRRFIHIRNLDGGTATPHILSPARPFWRHLDFMERLYHDLEKKTIMQENFIEEER